MTRDAIHLAKRIHRSSGLLRETLSDSDDDMVGDLLVISLGDAARHTGEGVRVAPEGDGDTGPAMYYSTNSSIITSDTALTGGAGQTGDPSFGVQAPGAHQVCLQVPVTIPTNATAGTRYLGAIVDFANQNTETNESNNTASISITITQ